MGRTAAGAALPADGCAYGVSSNLGCRLCLRCAKRWPGESEMCLNSSPQNSTLGRSLPAACLVTRQPSVWRRSKGGRRRADALPMRCLVASYIQKHLCSGRPQCPSLLACWLCEVYLGAGGAAARRGARRNHGAGHTVDMRSAALWLSERRALAGAGWRAVALPPWRWQLRWRVCRAWASGRRTAPPTPAAVCPRWIRTSPSSCATRRAPARRRVTICPGAGPSHLRCKHLAKGVQHGLSALFAIALCPSPS